ncbi:hypothetical protein K4F52_003301 [Lecanicillium sp. MT-2017a]|nr:hypothetical protein K4F52_003301 [Lecanicillium sp. MT-2017a]
MDTFKSPQRVDSAIGLTAEDEPPATPFLPFEASQLLSGLGIILDYLNDGNTVAELTGIKTRAFNWCVAYYYTVFFKCRTTKAIVDAHPHLFEPTIPSALRLEGPSDVDVEDEEMDQDEPEKEDQTGDKCPFPDYSEPVLLNDDVVYGVLELYDENKARLAASRHTFGTRISAKDLQTSPIIFYIPEVLCHLSSIRLLPLAMKERAEAAANAARNSDEQSAMDVDDTDQDVDQVMSDCQSESLRTQGPWGLLSSIIRT